jgi:hypothetical protein
VQLFLGYSNLFLSNICQVFQIMWLLHKQGEFKIIRPLYTPFSCSTVVDRTVQPNNISLLFHVVLGRTYDTYFPSNASVSYSGISGDYKLIIFFKRHLQSFMDLWPTLMGFSIYTQRHLVGLLGWGISPTQGLYRHRTTQHRNTRTHIHAPSRIRTCDPNVQAVVDSTCPRLLSHWDRLN